MKHFALITGASGGIGKCIATKLAEKGYSLYLHYNKNGKAVDGLLKELEKLGGEYIPVQADLASKDGYKVLASQVFDLDAIIHNAGHSVSGLLEDLDEDEAEKLIQVHVTSPLLLTKLLVPKLIRKKSGAIVTVSSIWGETGASCEIAYSMVKGAQISFVKALSKELAPSGIRVNAVAPGAVSTSMMAGFSLEELSQISEDIPLGRLGLPEEVADGVEFLLSNRASYITGHILSINGGWHM
ncbi:elongation factor P 5-aminopentanone reductase [Mesobacillus zeae]|uniref:SDR family oxidoreductase n=1 Tax=Mesobacillus zeae TaxID=1917180 RepID=A0A398BDR9_9BACI|nr:SDR family oxidoreductase [Mesobacillus zeae]RID88062.1 SDR family oxidoreductase [Mesobacillus zeae]